MNASFDPIRRSFIRAAAFAATAAFVSNVSAAGFLPTAKMSEGPLYPDRMPLDTDNDLLLLNTSDSPALGDITHLTGRVIDKNGQPVKNAFVEIWQCDANGVYIHTRDAGPALDKNFQGYGRFLTDSTGAYYFRTIKPVPYGFKGAKRTPHIHFAISKNGARIFTTQMFIKGHPNNKTDFLLKEIEPTARQSVLVDFAMDRQSKNGELEARFDIVLGKTIEENGDGVLSGGIAKPIWR